MAWSITPHEVACIFVHMPVTAFGPAHRCATGGSGCPARHRCNACPHIRAAGVHQPVAPGRTLKRPRQFVALVVQQIAGRVEGEGLHPQPAGSLQQAANRVALILTLEQGRFAVLAAQQMHSSFYLVLFLVDHDLNKVSTSLAKPITFCSASLLPILIFSGSFSIKN